MNTITIKMAKRMRSPARSFSILFFALVLAILPIGISSIYNGPAHAATNLISNPGFETAGSTGNPADWMRGGWGTNVRSYAYPVTGRSGLAAAQVTISAHTSGDAKWYFGEIPVSASTQYTYTDYYKATIDSYITVQYRHGDGHLSWEDVAYPGPSYGWQKASATFTTPADATALTVFHLINREGTLTLDDASLVVGSSSPPPTNGSNLIINPDLETMYDTGRPLGWLRGGWGSNTRAFVYPVSGHNGGSAARVSITNHISGDAKWYFKDVAVLPGTLYTFSNYYKATVDHYITARYTHSDGSYSYQDIAYPQATDTWLKTDVKFITPPDVVSLTIFHLLNANGSLTVDDYALYKTNDTTSSGRGIVSVVFDDGWKSIYQNAIPKLNALGIKSTQYIPGGRFGFPAYMTEQQVLELESQGHDIGAHSMTHSDLTTMPYQQARYEIFQSRQSLFDIGVQNVDTFAYPFGAYNDVIIDLVKQAGFTGARSTNNGLESVPPRDAYTIRRRSAEIHVTADDMKRWVDEAIQNDSWLVLTLHRVDNSGTRYSTPPTVFNEVADYIDATGVETATVRDVLLR